MSRQEVFLKVPHNYNW